MSEERIIKHSIYWWGEPKRANWSYAPGRSDREEARIHETIRGCCLLAWAEGLSQNYTEVKMSKDTSQRNDKYGDWAYQLWLNRQYNKYTETELVRTFESAYEAGKAYGKKAGITKWNLFNRDENDACNSFAFRATENLKRGVKIESVENPNEASHDYSNSIYAKVPYLALREAEEFLASFDVDKQPDKEKNNG